MANNFKGYPARLPWRITEALEKKGREIVGADGSTIAKLTGLDLANAELIVESVNNRRTPSSSHSAEGERQSAPTPRVEAVIADAMEKYAGGTPGRDLTYYQNVHQDLAPLARQLERELDRTKAELTELRVQMARSAGDAVPAEQKQADESNVAPASQHGMDFGVDADAERALFETWARDPVRSEKLPLDRWPTNDGYKDSRTYIAFYGWKARAKVDSGFREGRNTNDSNSEVAAPTNTAPAVQPEPVEGKKRADFLTWWTSIEIDVRKSMLVFASRDRERLLALVRMAYEQGQDSANESAEGAKP